MFLLGYAWVFVRVKESGLMDIDAVTGVVFCFYLFDCLD